MRTKNGKFNERSNKHIVGYMKLDFLFFFFSFSRSYVIGEKEIYKERRVGVKSLEDCRRGEPRFPGNLYLGFPRLREPLRFSLSLSRWEKLSRPCIGVARRSTSREIVDESAYIRSTWRFMRPNRRIYGRRNESESEARTGEGENVRTMQRQNYDCSWRFFWNGKYLREYSRVLLGIIATNSNRFLSNLQFHRQFRIIVLIFFKKFTDIRRKR